MIDVRTKAGVNNVYELVVKRPGSEDKKYVFHNMVLDNYFSYLISNKAAPQFSVIRLGQGTDAVEATQTTLGSLRASYRAAANTYTDTTPVSRVLQYTIPEGTLTGNISEIGLSNDTTGSTVYTRALVQDAEGNPIVIEKGALDILTVQVTVFYTFTYDVDEPWFIIVDERQPAVDLANGSSYRILEPYMRYFTSLPGPNFNSYETMEALQEYASSSTIVSDVGAKTIRSNGAVITAANGNGPMGVPEWAARAIGTNTFIIDVEHSDMFVPYQYNNLSMGVGDGVETGFDIPLVFFRAEDVEVTIDGVLQDPETYVVEPHSLRRSLRSAPSAMSEFCTYISHNSVCAGLFSRGSIYEQGAGINTVREARYDFGSNILVTHVFGKNDPFVQSTSSARPYPLDISLYSSDDGEAWSLVFYRSAAIGVQQFLSMPLDNPVTARYFRLTYRVDLGYVGLGSSVDPILAFGRDTKSITFNTPPAIGAVLTAKVTSRVPIKNSNFQLGASIQMKFERG